MELSPLLFGLYKFAKFFLYPVTWLAFSLGWLTLILLLPYSPRRHNKLRLFGLSACFILLPLGTPMVSGSLLAWWETLAPPFDESVSRRFDAIVVLGGGVKAHGTLRPDDSLSEFSLERTTCGADLFLRNFAPKLVLTGGDARVFGRGPVESVVMAQWATRLGVPRNAIVAETKSRTTYENAVEARALLGPGSVLLVTSAGHIPRAVALFRKQGFQVTPYPCGYLSKDRPEDLSDTFTPFDAMPQLGGLAAAEFLINEVMGFAVYWLAGKV
ncbi:YdcF family protein [Nitrospira tepida]|uniref:YdcF family protein n=1 Tax=Nitrospira tepida TaxID=2973512 RepID=A0AA86T7E0_9BACT|nr:YdcF family protein [Nitrospira tepida]CAI4033615.1 YdcF family protein [Nitrospira tepida]